MDALYGVNWITLSLDVVLSILMICSMVKCYKLLTVDLVSTVLLANTCKDAEEEFAVIPGWDQMPNESAEGVHRNGLRENGEENDENGTDGEAR